MLRVLRNDERLIEENFFTFPESYAMNGPVFSDIVIVPFKTGAFGKNVFYGHDLIVYYRYIQMPSTYGADLQREGHFFQKGGQRESTG